MTSIVRVPFNGDEILAVDIDGKPHIVLKPAFEAIGLDADRQIRNVRRREWATTSVTAVVAADGKVRSMVTADVRTFLMALATIPASRVAEHVRSKLIAYQSEVADAIEQYWTEGGAINPRANDEQLAWLAARADARNTRKTFTQFLESVYAASSTSGTFPQWAATITTTMTTTVLGISTAEFRDRKARAGGNFRDAATTEELERLNNAEAFIRARFGLVQDRDIKSLYYGAKNALQELIAA